MEEKIFSRNKILIVIFIILAIINAIIASLVARGAYVDGAIWITEILNKLADNEYGIWINPDRARSFILVLEQLPINIAYYIFKINDKYWLSVFFTLPLFFYPLMGLYWNYTLAKRCERYDIFILNFLTYAFVVLPGMMYSVVEINFGVILFFILFNYLIAQINYNKIDIVAIAFLLIMLFNSHETGMFIGFMLFVFSFYYSKKEKNSFNQNVKRIIGIFCLFASIYLTYFSLQPHILTEGIRYFKEIFNVILYGRISHSIVSIFGVLVICLLGLNKKYYKKIDFIFLVLIYVLLLLYLLLNPQIYINSSFFLFRVWLSVFVCIFIFYVFINDFNNRSYNKIIYTNLLTIICLTANLYTIWDISNSCRFYSEYKYYSDKISTSFKNVIVYKEYEDIYPRTGINIYHTPDTYFVESVLFNRNYKINTIIIPPENLEYNNEVYVLDDEVVHGFGSLDIKNKFWDLTEVAKSLPKKNPRDIN